MKLQLFPTILFCATMMLTQGCDKNDQCTGIDGNHSVENVTVTGASGYTKTALKPGMSLWPGDEENTLEAVGAYFTDFEVLTSQKGVHNGGVIIPEHSGIVYLLSASAALPHGWIVVPGSSVIYTPPGADKAVNIAIYSKQAYAGKPVKIPIISGDLAAYPLGRHLKYIPEE